jgi:hypothetical protein
MSADCDEKTGILDRFDGYQSRAESLLCSADCPCNLSLPNIIPDRNERRLQIVPAGAIDHLSNMNDEDDDEMNSLSGDSEDEIDTNAGFDDDFAHVDEEVQEEQPEDNTEHFSDTTATAH